MAGCDLCGKEPIVGKAKIEGALMSVCATCCGYGAPVVGARSGPEPWTLHRKRSMSKPADAGMEAQVRPDLATMLRKARERSGQTQEEFANRLGVKLSAYHHYESGSGMPDFAVAKRMERALGTHIIVGMRNDLPSQSSTVAESDAKRDITIGDLMRQGTRERSSDG